MTALRPVPLWLHVPRGRVRVGAPKDADAAPLTSEFIGMAGYTLASFHDLVDDEVESDGSNISDVMAPGHPLSQECAVADAPRQPPMVAESL